MSPGNQRGCRSAPTTIRRPSPSSLPAGRFSSSGRGSSTSLAQCHDDNWGQKLGGATIPQGHPTGYPLYRLEWQSLGSLQRRLRNCLVGMRAAPYAYGTPEMTELELFLARRAQGLTLETPAVRP
jgi:sulfur-oxidizing protein SoxA